MGQSTFTPLFKTIPPERIGLDGTYDHQGLAKRVLLALSENFEPEAIAHLRVSQRGAVVVVMGKVSDQRTLVRLVNIAIAVNGAADVEVNGISVAEPLKFYLQVKPSKLALENLLSLVNTDK